MDQLFLARACYVSLAIRQILKMMEAFKEGKTLNIKYAWPLIKQAKEIFSKEATIQVGP